MAPTPDPGPPRGLDAAALARLLGDQSGVVSRAQVVACGGAPHDLGRLVRRRELVRVLPGVFVDHTGRPTWLQRAWAGCLYYEPAALAGPSALRAVAGPGWRHHDDSGPVHLAIDVSRRCVDAPGYRVRRVAGLAAKVQWNMSPPRIRAEEAALDEALRQPSRFAMIGVLADICQSRRTTAHRVLEAAGERGRLTDRSWLCGVLADIADGTCSTLEHAYLDLVERAHGLPVGRRQQPGSSERSGVLRDVDYDPLLFLVELDGRLSTTPPASGTAISTATSTPPSTAAAPCAWGGARSSTARAAPPPGWRPCSPGPAGRVRPPDVGPIASSSPGSLG